MTLYTQGDTVFATGPVVDDAKQFEPRSPSPASPPWPYHRLPIERLRPAKAHRG